MGGRDCWPGKKVLVLHWDIASLGGVGDKGDFGTLGVDLSAIEAGKAGHMGLGSWETCRPGLLMLKNSWLRFHGQNLGPNGAGPPWHEEAGCWVSLVEESFAQRGLPCPGGSPCRATESLS